MHPLPRALGLLTILLPAAALADAAPSAPAARLTDPVFGVRYVEGEADFTPAPAELLARCPELTTDKWTRRMWVYARSKERGVEHMVVGGQFVPRGGGAAMADAKGAVLQLIDGGRCELVSGPARETFDYTDRVPGRALSALAADAACRGARAFGGRDAWLKLLAQQKRTPDKAKSELLAGAIKAPSLSCSP